MIWPLLAFQKVCLSAKSDAQDTYLLGAKSLIRKIKKLLQKLPLQSPRMQEEKVFLLGVAVVQAVEEVDVSVVGEIQVISSNLNSKAVGNHTGSSNGFNPAASANSAIDQSITEPLAIAQTAQGWELKKDAPIAPAAAPPAAKKTWGQPQASPRGLHFSILKKLIHRCLGCTIHTIRGHTFYH